MNLDRFKNLKVAIGIPSNGYWLTDFATNYCNMIVYFQSHKVGDFKSQFLQTISTKGSILPKSRREIVKIALEMKANYLLWLDTDHTFPRNMLHRLISHNKDVVGANCVTKMIPSHPTARYKPKGDDPVQGLPVYTDPSSPELEKVWRLGCGVMLVDMKVYRKIGPNVFDMLYRSDVDAYQGEDWSMCEAIEKAGFEIWVDHPLSDQVGHVGLYNFTHDVVGDVRGFEQAKKEREMANTPVGLAVAKAYG